MHSQAVNKNETENSYYKGITNYDRILLQNASDITKYIRYYKVWQTVITKCVSYYKVRQLLQSET